MFEGLKNDQETQNSEVEIDFFVGGVGLDWGDGDCFFFDLEVFCGEDLD